MFCTRISRCVLKAMLTFYIATFVAAKSTTSTTVQPPPTSTISATPGRSPCSTDFVMRPYQERECLLGLECVYGVCVDGIACQCDIGASGFLCDSMCCPTCIKNDSATVSRTSTFNNVTPTAPDSTLISTSVPGHNYSPCEPNFIERPQGQRSCAFIECVYGICEESETSLGCRCDPGGFGLLCEEMCCLQCGLYGVCSKDNGSEFCNCHANYTGSTCNEFRTFAPSTMIVPVPTSPLWYPWLIAICVFLLIIIILIALLFLMKKRRVIPVMQIFRFLQRYEDDDDRQWDAFVSYKSVERDEHFVVNTLLPKLESDMNFKLHFHARDFLPGETIVNNIITAIQGSRRTIIIVTPEFLKSSYTQFEYERALDEMATKKHRIIPILLEDVSGVKHEINTSLKNILSSVTYIEWPAVFDEKKLEHFWKQVELSMPKKRKVETVDRMTTFNTLNTPKDSQLIPDNESVECNSNKDPNVSSQGPFVKDESTAENTDKDNRFKDSGVYDSLDDISSASDCSYCQIDNIKSSIKSDFDQWVGSKEGVFTGDSTRL